ncbi:MAG: stage III sporulation protein AA [Lachnospiraceae bacterium]|nr:stage III sporulation protein AA [Lachnospiraceae bacterium]
MVLLFIFPIHLKNVISNMLDRISYEHIEEIRIRANKPIVIKCRDKHLLSDYIAKIDDVHSTIELAVEHSVYAHSDEIKNGYITIEGGHRIGVCGQVVCENGVIVAMKHISSINIRVAHQVKGCADKLMEEIYNKNGIDNTLIISSPGLGKTTLLRDIVRQLSDRGIDIGLVDERGEVAAAYMGIAQNDVGKCTDVLSFCKKSIGMTMLIRSMGPKVVVADEIGSKEDIDAIINATNSGCNVIATAHGSGVEDINKDTLKHFRKFILIQKVCGERIYKIFDRNELEVNMYD